MISAVLCCVLAERMGYCVATFFTCLCHYQLPITTVAASPLTHTQTHKSQVVDTHRDVERKAVLQMLAISLHPCSSTSQSTQSPSALTHSTSTNSTAALTRGTSGSSISSSTGVTGSNTDLAHMKGGSGHHLLLTLTVDGVNVHSLPNARLRCQVRVDCVLLTVVCVCV